MLINHHTVFVFTKCMGKIITFAQGFVLICRDACGSDRDREGDYSQETKGHLGRTIHNHTGRLPSPRPTSLRTSGISPARTRYCRRSRILRSHILPEEGEKQEHDWDGRVETRYCRCWSTKERQNGAGGPMVGSQRPILMLTTGAVHS